MVAQEENRTVKKRGRPPTKKDPTPVSIDLNATTIDSIEAEVVAALMSGINEAVAEALEEVPVQELPPRPPTAAIPIKNPKYSFKSNFVCSYKGQLLRYEPTKQYVIEDHLVAYLRVNNAPMVEV